jgi:hypothetical protein
MVARNSTDCVELQWRSTVSRMRILPHSVESLTEEIGRIVAERQELRAAGASPEVLEENRRRLAEAQNRLSVLLIERHLPVPG